jgi:hypothetical protein
MRRLLTILSLVTSLCVTSCGPDVIRTRFDVKMHDEASIQSLDCALVDGNTLTVAWDEAGRVWTRTIHLDGRTVSKTRQVGGATGGPRVVSGGIVSRDSNGHLLFWKDMSDTPSTLNPDSLGVLWFDATSLDSKVVSVAHVLSSGPALCASSSGPPMIILSCWTSSRSATGDSRSRRNFPSWKKDLISGSQAGPGAPRTRSSLRNKRHRSLSRNFRRPSIGILETGRRIRSWRQPRRNESHDPHELHPGSPSQSRRPRRVGGRGAVHPLAGRSDETGVSANLLALGNDRIRGQPKDSVGELDRFRPPCSHGSTATRSMHPSIGA